MLATFRAPFLISEKQLIALGLFHFKMWEGGGAENNSKCAYRGANEYSKCAYRGGSVLIEMRWGGGVPPDQGYSECGGGGIRSDMSIQNVGVV